MQFVAVFFCVFLLHFFRSAVFRQLVFIFCTSKWSREPAAFSQPPSHRVFFLNGGWTIVDFPSSLAKMGQKWAHQIKF